MELAERNAAKTNDSQQEVILKGAGLDGRNIKIPRPLSEAKTLTEAEDNAFCDHPIWYLFRLIEEETGIASEVLRDATWRVNTEFGLAGYKPPTGRSEQPDLRWIFQEFKQLDGDGSTGRLLGELWKKHPTEAAEMGLQSPTSKQPVDDGKPGRWWWCDRTGPVNSSGGAGGSLLLTVKTMHTTRCR